MLRSKTPDSGRKPVFIEEAAFGRLPQRGRAAPRPAPLWESFVEAGVRPECGVLLPNV
jgi:hypothetical protein